MFGVNDIEFSRDTIFVMNEGNAGDGLIALGTRHYLQARGIADPMVCQASSERLADAKTIVFGGGGNLIPKYKTALSFIRSMCSLGKQVLILPHTTYGYEKELVELSSSLTFICREMVSYKLLRASGFPANRLGLDDDMALHIDPAFLSEGLSASSAGTANCFRTDSEASTTRQRLPAGNRDISLSWNGGLWHDQLLANFSSRCLIAYLSQFESVRTDRLHIGILSALLGKRVSLFPNSYFKNQAVYDFSLRDRFSSRLSFSVFS